MCNLAVGSMKCIQEVLPGQGHTAGMGERVEHSGFYSKQFHNSWKAALNSLKRTRKNYAIESHVYMNSEFQLI